MFNNQMDAMERRNTVYGTDITTIYDYDTLNSLKDRLNKEFSVPNAFFCLSTVNELDYDRISVAVTQNMMPSGIDQLKSGYIQQRIVSNFKTQELQIVFVKFTQEPFGLEIMRLVSLVNVLPYRELIPS